MYTEEKMSSNEIAKAYGCWATTIRYYLKKWDVQIRNPISGEQYNNIYDADVHYFDDIDSAEKAYWLGYIASDGHVSDETSLMLCCQYLDVDILKNFKRCIKSNHPIKVNQKGHVMLQITSKHMAKTLKRYGFEHDKTFTMHLREIIQFIPEEHQWAFFTGLFDGDGSIRFYNYEYVQGFQYHFGFTGVKESVELFAERFHIHTKLVDEGNGIYTVRTSNAPHIYWCLHQLYDNATIYCYRKYITAEHVYRLIDKENKNKVKGVTFEGSSGKWVVQVKKDGKNFKVGRYESKDEAERVRLQYEFDNFNESDQQWYHFDKYGIGKDL